MRKLFTLVTFLISLTVATIAAAFPVTIHPGDYRGGYTITNWETKTNYWNESIIEEIDLPEGTYRVTIGDQHNHFYFRITLDGVIETDSSRVSLDESKTFLEFITVPINIDSKDYLGGCVIAGIGFGGEEIIYLLPAGSGVDDDGNKYKLAIGDQHNNTYFYLDEFGNVSSDSTRFTTHEDTITVTTTVPVTIDPGHYQGGWVVAGLGYGGLQTMELIPGGLGIDDDGNKYKLAIGDKHNNLYFYLDGEGAVTGDSTRFLLSEDENNKITLKTVSVVFDPGEERSDLTYNIGGNYFLGKQMVSLVPAGDGVDDSGSAYKITTYTQSADATVFDAGATCDTMPSPVLVETSTVGRIDFSLECPSPIGITVDIEPLTEPNPGAVINALHFRDELGNKTILTETTSYTFPDGTYTFHPNNYGDYGSVTIDNYMVTEVTGSLVYDSVNQVISFDVDKLSRVAIKFSDIDVGRDEILFTISGVDNVIQGNEVFYLPDGNYVVVFRGVGFTPFGTVTIVNGKISVNGYLIYDENNENILFNLEALTKVGIYRGDEIGFHSHIYGVGGALYKGEYIIYLRPDTYQIIPRGNVDPYGKIIVADDGSVSTTDLLLLTDSVSNRVEFDIEHAPNLTFRFDQLTEPGADRLVMYSDVYEIMGSAYEKSGLFPNSADFYIRTMGVRTGDFLTDADGRVTTSGFLTVESEVVDQTGRVETVIGFNTCEMNAVTIAPQDGKRFWFHPHYSTYDATTVYMPSGTYKISSDDDLKLIFEVSPQDGISVVEGPDSDSGDPPFATLALTQKECEQDTDGDGIFDDEDVCPEVPDPDQVDQDLDGMGNACDPDLDGDGIPNDVDNCEEDSNSDQSDLDFDGRGDACDNDLDGDSVNDTGDNCPNVHNTDQADNDNDLLGDVCDTDDDNDGVLDLDDNCQFSANSTQVDFDNDGEGDVCDGDIDNDTIVNEEDECPDTPSEIPIYTNGCSGMQYIALLCNKDDFIKHGKYVSCVAHASKDAVEYGLITNKERGRIVSQAAKKK